MSTGYNEKDKLNQLLALGKEITRIKDVDVLLERILTLARETVNADAGSIYVREGDLLKFSYTQNDTLQSKLQPGKKLIYSTFTIPISHNSIAGYVASTGELLNIHDLYELPDSVPYGFDKSFDMATGYRSMSTLTLPLKTHRGVIGVLQLINAKDGTGNIRPFSTEDEPMITHLASNAASAVERAQMTRALILRMIKMAELRDPKETGGHVNRVAAYAVEIYETWAVRRGIPPETIRQSKDLLRMAAMLHDVGKIAIADAILKKPARLDADEVKVMQQHCWLGSKLFTDMYSEFDDASNIVALNHHEKWDGSGYPGHIDPLTGKPVQGYENSDGSARGKKGEEIHPFGRVVAIADVYDALSCRRCYKEPWDETRVIETLKEDAGTHFDPEMIEAFIESLDVLRSVAERYPE
jgi:HD-GYP domain-containing protein (c-di-GMP phosphodiesterase class II)